MLSIIADHVRSDVPGHGLQSLAERVANVVECSEPMPEKYLTAIIPDTPRRQARAFRNIFQRGSSLREVITGHAL